MSLWVLRAVIAFQIAQLAAIAWRLPVDYWDGYEYLMNARTLAGHDVGRLGSAYVPHRFPLVPLLAAPLLLGYAPGGAGTSLRGPHLLAVALSALSLVALHRLLRQAFSGGEALLGCTVLALNRFFLHYAPFVMTDIPTMLCLTVAAVSYLRARRGGGWPAHAVAAIALCAAMLGRYTMVLFLGSLAVFEAARVLMGRTGEEPPSAFGRRVWRLVTDVRPWLIVGGALALVYVAHVAVYARAHIGLYRLVDLFLGQGPAVADWDLASELATAFSRPVLAVALVGMVLAAFRPTEVDLLCLAWFVVMFGLLSLIPFKETRYAFPVVPPFVYFVVRGGRGLWQALVRLGARVIGRSRAAAAIPALLSGLALILLAVRPVALAASELGRFRDPVYTRPFLPDVARWVLARSAPGHRILFSNASGGLGFGYTMYPANPFFSPHDRYYYFHHIGAPALFYLLDRPIERTEAVPPVAGDDLASLVERFTESEVILGSSGRSLDTSTAGSVPEPPEPLTLTFVGRRTLTRSDTNGQVYEGSGGPPNRLVFTPGTAWDIRDGGLDAGWQLYARRVDGSLTRIRPGTTRELSAVLELVRVEQLQVSFR